MSKRFLSGINVTGTATLNTVADAGSNTDKFLVLDASNNVSYRTAAELYADLGIGALPAAYTSTLKHEVKASQTISKGQAVYVSSADGTNMIVSKASNVSEATSSKTMGLLETSLVTNGKGNVITEGLLSGLNTNGANAGDPVWLGVDGALIFGLINKPVAPAHLVFIGIVTRANANNGEIFVKVQNGFEMNELHNYQEGSVQNNQVIVYESSTSLYKPKTIPTILGYTPVPDSRTLTINGTTYDLTANRSWTVSANQNARTEYEFTTNGSTATYSAVYSVGQVDVFYNGSKLSSTEFTATNGTSVTLGFTPPSGQLVEVVAWETGGGVTNGRTLTINGVAYDLSANRSWTIDNASLGAQAQLNGTGLVRMNGTTVTYDNATYATQSYVTTAVSNLVNAAPSTLDTLNELAAALGNDANFATTITTSISTKQAQLNGTGFVKVSGTTVSYDNSTYLTSINSSQVTTALGYTPYNATNPSGYITSSALSAYLPLTGGTLTGALIGTSATFSNGIFTDGSQGLSVRAYTGGAGFGAIYSTGVTAGAGNFALAASPTQTILSGVDNVNLAINSAIKLSIASTGAATFSSSVTAGASIGVSNGSTIASNNFYLLNSSTNKQWNIVNIGSGVSGRVGNFEINNNVADIFAITQAGKVGIKVSSPDAPLHVGGAILVSNNAQTFRRAITNHGATGTFTEVKVIFNKTNWGSVTYDIKLASAGGSYHTAGAYYSNPGFSSHINSVNAGVGCAVALTAESPNGGSQGATWRFYGATMIHPMVTVDIASGNGYQVNPDDIIVQFN